MTSPEFESDKPVKNEGQDQAAPSNEGGEVRPKRTGRSPYNKGRGRRPRDENTPAGEQPVGENQATEVGAGTGTNEQASAEGESQADLRADRVIQEVIVAINLPEVQETKAATVTEVIKQITHLVIKNPKPVQQAKRAKLYLHRLYRVNLTLLWIRLKLKLK
jgi:hypothetical protein